MSELALVQDNRFSVEQVNLIKSQIAPKATDDELKLFLYQASRTGLDPLSRQIYAIHRNQYDPETRQTVAKMTIQTSIDGFRLIAERTGRYSPGPETAYVYGKDERPVSATAYVLKRTLDGVWHTVAACAHFSEYAQSYNGKLSKMWEEKPHIMLGKCAEALALRKAFPAEMSGLYTSDEMGKADEMPAAATADKVAQAAAPVVRPNVIDASASKVVEKAREVFNAPPEGKVQTWFWSDGQSKWAAKSFEPACTDQQVEEVLSGFGKLKMSTSDISKALTAEFNKKAPGELSADEAVAILEIIEAKLAKK